MPLDFLTKSVDFLVHPNRPPFFSDTLRRRPGVSFLDGLKINQKHYGIRNFDNDPRRVPLKAVDGIRPIEIDIEMPDGLKCRGAIFRPSTQCRGTVVYLEGKSEFIEMIQRLANAHVRDGWQVIVVDLRGQGGTGPRGKRQWRHLFQRFSGFARRCPVLF